MTSSKESILFSHGYAVNGRDPAVKPEFEGRWMLTDIDDTRTGSYAIVGDDPAELVEECYSWAGLGPVASDIPQNTLCQPTGGPGI